MGKPKTHSIVGSGVAGPGRPKGVQNKVTASVKDLFMEVVGTIESDPKYAHAKLLNWGSKNPHLFWPLATKLIPTEVNTHVDGEITFVEQRNYPTKAMADAKVINITPNEPVDQANGGS